MNLLREKLEDEFSLLFSEHSEHLDLMASYHFGTGGKRFRGLLALKEGEELGVLESDTLKWAVACEILHNATLVHDDIQDDDPLRRGQESTWIKFGRNQAINLGDYLIFTAFEALSGLETTSALSGLLQCLSCNAKEVVQGQSLELQMSQMKPSSLWQNYLQVATLKTGALLRAPIEGVGILSGESLEAARVRSEPWKKLGLVYQINDDINDFLGKKQADQSLKDFQEQKINSIVAWLSLNDENKNLLTDYLHCEKGSDEHQVAIERMRDVAIKSHALSELHNVKTKFYQKFQWDVTGSSKDMLNSFFKPLGTQETTSHERELN